MVDVMFPADIWKKQTVYYGDHTSVTIHFSTKEVAIQFAEKFIEDTESDSCYSDFVKKEFRKHRVESSN